MKELILPANQLIYFPVTTGITSMAYKKQKAFYFNEFNPHHNIYYNPDVDNIKSIDKIDNIIISHMTREDGTTNGIIQMYNHGVPVQSTHRKKLEAIARFFGSCVENIEDITKKITSTLAVSLDDRASEPLLETSDAAAKDCQLAWQSFLPSMEGMTDSVVANLK